MHVFGAEFRHTMGHAGGRRDTPARTPSPGRRPRPKARRPPSAPKIVNCAFTEADVAERDETPDAQEESRSSRRFCSTHRHTMERSQTDGEPTAQRMRVTFTRETR